MRRTLLVIPVLICAAAVAHAECPSYVSHVDTLIPPDGGTGVPLNGDISFSLEPTFGLYAPKVVVTSSGGAAPISGALTEGPFGAWTFRPDATLSPLTTYLVLVTDMQGNGVSRSSTFMTGTTSDTADPVQKAAPVLTVGSYVDPVHSGTCEQPGYYHLNASWPAAADAGPVLYTMSVNIVDLSPDPGFTSGGVVGSAVTSSGLSAVINVPGLSEVTVSVITTDEAGRQDHSAAAVIDVPDAPSGGRANHGCACDLGEPATLGGALLAAAAALAATVRRRGRTSPGTPQSH